MIDLVFVEKSLHFLNGSQWEHLVAVGGTLRYFSLLVAPNGLLAQTVCVNCSTLLEACMASCVGESFLLQQEGLPVKFLKPYVNEVILEFSSILGALTSARVLLAGPSVLTGVVVAGSRRAAALIHPKRPPAPRPRPLRRVTHSDWLPIELEALKATSEITRMAVVVLSAGSKEQSTMGAHHPAWLGQGDGGWMLLVQGQSQGGGVDLQQDVVPAAI